MLSIDIIKAIIMGVMEGATEFLPVSSTGHLILTADLLDFQKMEGLYEIVIQTGAILAVILLYFAKLWKTLVGLPSDRTAQNFALAVTVGFLPAGVIGFLLGDFIKAALFSPLVVSISLIAGGIIMLGVERLSLTPRLTSVDAITLPVALKIGLLQCLAMIPGVSRSGATIIGGLLLGVERKAAAEFSFYLAIPTLVGAAVLEMVKSGATLAEGDLMLIAVGFGVSFLTALVVIKAFIGWLSNHGFGVFAWYRIVLGVVMIALISGGYVHG